MEGKQALAFLLALGILALAGCGADTAASHLAERESMPREAAETLEPETPAVETETPVMETEPEAPVEDASREEAPPETETEAPAPEPAEETPAEPEQTEEETEMILKLIIGDTPVATAWERNDSVEALKALCADGPLVIEMSMYGGFEQVGDIGTSLPRNDAQTTTESGDIVLYSGDQIVTFYGSNSWAYTRLGHITDRSPSEMKELLGSGDVTITLSLEAGE